MICRWHFRHLAPWTRKTNGIPEPPQCTTQQYTIHYGNRRRRPPSIPGYRHIQKDRWLPRAQSVTETHPHQSLPTLEFPSPSSQQTISPLFPYTQSKSSLWPRFPCTRTWNPHHHFQGQWIQPSTDTTSHETGNTGCQVQGYTHLYSIHTIHPNYIRPTQQNVGQT